jgi:hypothetical protein
MPPVISANNSYTLDLLPRSGRADKEMAPYSHLPAHSSVANANEAAMNFAASITNLKRILKVLIANESMLDD